MARAKRFDVAIQACNQLGIKLKIFGRDFSGVSDDLKKLAGPTIEFLGEIDNHTEPNFTNKPKPLFFPPTGRFWHGSGRSHELWLPDHRLSQWGSY